MDNLRAVATARELGLLFLCAVMPEGEWKGGTAIIIPYSSIECKDKESLDSAIQRIRSSVFRKPDGRAIAATILHEGREIRVMSVYAPVQDAERASFFTSIAPHVPTTSPPTRSWALTPTAPSTPPVA